MVRILKYNEAKMKITQLITARSLIPGDRIPSERELAGQLGVSIISIRRAVEELQDAGIIQRKQGVGMFYTGNLVHKDYNSMLGIISVNDPEFPSGREMSLIYNGLQKYHADYRVFSVGPDVDTSRLDEISACDRFLISGFSNLPWLDFLRSQGKPFVQLGISTHHHEMVCQVKFDWEGAFRELIRRLVLRGKKKIGLLLIHPNAANCSANRYEIFERIIREQGLPMKNGWISYANPKKNLAHIREYMDRFGSDVDAFLVDYHVFNYLTMERMIDRKPLCRDVVVLETTPYLEEDFNFIDGFAKVCFPDTVAKAGIDILYEYPYSFIEERKTLFLPPRLSGRALEV